MVWNRFFSDGNKRQWFKIIFEPERDPSCGGEKELLCTNVKGKLPLHYICLNYVGFY